MLGELMDNLLGAKAVRIDRQILDELLAQAAWFRLL
jgi:hypothetical protein